MTVVSRNDRKGYIRDIEANLISYESESESNDVYQTLPPGQSAGCSQRQALKVGLCIKGTFVVEQVLSAHLTTSLHLKFHETSAAKQLDNPS